MTLCDIEAAGIGLGILAAAVTCFHYLGKVTKYFLDDDTDDVPSIIIGFVSALVGVLSIVLLIIIIGGLLYLGHFILGC